MVAAVGGHADVARTLLEHDAQPNAATVDGMTALMYASMFRHRAACLVLIAGGAEVTARDRDGVTAADRARNHGDLEMLALLHRAMPSLPPLAA
jgi:ankyrin repeat protein